MNSKNQDRINFRTVIDLGFKVDRSPSDAVFFDRNGYEYFIVYKDYFKGKISIDWDCETRTCEMRRLDKEGNVLSRIRLEDEGELIMMDEFLTGKAAQERNPVK